MTLEVPESPKPAASRRNPVKKVMFRGSDAVFSSRFKEALVVTQRSIFLRASAREV
jgi:hypothetical protein